MKNALKKQIHNLSDPRGIIALICWGIMAIPCVSAMAAEISQMAAPQSKKTEQIVLKAIQELDDARQKALETVPQVSPEKAGGVVEAYLTQAQQIVEKMNLAVQGKWSAPHPAEFRKWLNRRDLILQEKNGTTFSRLNVGAEVGRFSPWLSPAWQAYFRWIAVEDAQPALEDGNMMIPWDDYRKRLIIVENLIRQYPDFSQKPLLEKVLRDKIWFYLNGTDNTPLIADDGHVRPEILESYRNFIQDDPQSRYYPVVRQYYEMLEKNRFIPDRETARFAESVLQ